MNSISYLDAMKIASCRDNGDSYRGIQKKLNIPKSTIHYNIGEIKKFVRNLENYCGQHQKESLVKAVLSLSMVGKCSTRSTSRVISMIWNIEISHQTVKTILDECATIASKENKELSLKSVLCPLFDEIFHRKTPILGFADAISGGILLTKANHRKKEDWVDTLEKLAALGLNPESTNTDGAQALKEAIKIVFGNATQIRDLFHVLKKFNSSKHAMERHCYNLIYLNDQACVKKDISEEKKAKMGSELDRAIDYFDEFEKLLSRFHLGSTIRSGNDDYKYINSTELAWILRKMYKCLSRFIKEISDKKVIKASQTYIKNGFREILSYKKMIEDKVGKNWPDYLKNFALSYFTRLSEYIDGYMKAYENKKNQKYWGSRIVELRSATRNTPLFKDDIIDECINEHWGIFNEVHKSNSYIEAVNSVIRAYLNAYKSIPSWFCELFSFYWNNRVFTRGKRVGLSPAKCLSQDDSVITSNWYEKLLEQFPYDKIRCELPLGLPLAA